MFLNLMVKIRVPLLLIVFILPAGCNHQAQDIDLVNNEAHKQQAFNQILDNPELQQEFIIVLMNNEDAMRRMMQNRDFTGELYSRENMKYIWDQNPGIDSAVIDNVTTRMHTDTNFLKKIDDRMESGTPSNIP